MKRLGLVKWARKRAKPRDSFFFAVGCAIAYHEVFVAKEAQPLLIFTTLFLWGLIPAFWGDRSPASPPPPPSPPPDPSDFPPPDPDDRVKTRLTLCVALAA